MSPALQMTGHHAPPYAPRSDVMDRHDYGITKNRKPASTGGGRAWSEDEEAYLLQTRMQKMPYKHIAAYLKKTELACRLHYHQLSHGSNRRKRTTSMSSGSSNSGHSPVLQTSLGSPIHEHGGAPSRSVSPPMSAGSYGSTSPVGIQLPSIMSATASTSTSPRLPTILPKPASMTLALASISGSCSTGTASPTASRGYPTPLHDTHPHNMAPMTSSGYRGPANLAARSANNNPTNGPHHHHHHAPAPMALRLDCSALPPPPSSGGLPAPPGFGASHPVDMGRLSAVYHAHRASFWAAVATDYGPGANPHVLEQAWRGTASSATAATPTTTSAAMVGGSGNGLGGNAMAMNGGIAAQTPITPVGSPDDQLYSAHHPGGGCGTGHYHLKPDKTRISAILGIDANPRSPSEREMVRRIEEERGGGVGMMGVVV